jgi:hypothetical protein
MSDKLSNDIYCNKAINESRKDEIELKIDTNDVDEYTIRVYGLYYNVAYFNNAGSFGGLHYFYQN